MTLDILFRGLKMFLLTATSFESDVKFQQTGKWPLPPSIHTYMGADLGRTRLFIAWDTVFD